MKKQCENDICHYTAQFKIAGINCCAHHMGWAARKGLEQSEGQEITLAWAAEEAA